MQKVRKTMKNAIMSYYEDGALVKVYAYKAPAKSQRTFPAVKGSVCNMGAKAVTLGCSGVLKRKHG